MLHIVCLDEPAEQHSYTSMGAVGAISLSEKTQQSTYFWY